MNVLKYSCLECDWEKWDNESIDYYKKCPICGSEIALYTDIKYGYGYRVLELKKASDLKEGDMYFYKMRNESYCILGIKKINKKRKPVINIGLQGFGSITLREDEMVYCVLGIWNK